MGRLILPQTEINDLDEKVLFLAGPIAGAPVWQETAIDYLIDKTSAYFVSPRRKHSEEYMNLEIEGRQMEASQAEWEEHYLNIAAEEGAILLWIPRQVEELTHKMYAGNTMRELIVYTERARHKKVNIEVGVEEEFEEGNRLFRTFFKHLRRKSPDFVIHRTLEDTCEATLETYL